ncbi:MAG: diaminopimelate epimerase, partial [Gammaproteobacteria bacterium]|nr:diaminopimelate epimerase [Gammaproteobacteria bacterium]
INQSFNVDPALVRAWADRRNGVGFDQMLIVEPPQTDRAAFRYRIFNADGGEVSQCGNGARCFARFVRENELTDEDVITVETNAGLLELQAVDESRVRVNMGVPQFDPALIPLATDNEQKQYTINHEGEYIHFSALSIGNPHMIIQVEDVDTAPVERLGTVLESHEFFPQRVNVGFMQIVDRKQFRLRVFERGVGETLACGSGACAAMVAAVKSGELDNQARAFLRGGELKLEWQGDGKPVMMTGDTALVFEGEIDYEQNDE